MLTPVEEIKSRLNIVDVASTYIRLQKAGANFKALCPFHKERTPSFIVSPARQSWHCFGACNEGGDMFSFVMKMEGLDFPDALRALARRAGVVLRAEDPKLRSERSSILLILEEAAKFYETQLNNHPEPLRYLQEKRGMKPETIKDFRVGFAPNDWRALLDHLTSIGFKSDQIEKAGLVVKIPNSKFQSPKYYDRFRSRIIFPVFDANSQVVGFSGRIFDTQTVAEPTQTDAETNQLKSLPDWQAGAFSPRLPSPDGSGRMAGTAHESAPAKYINTPETLVYSKGKILYGFERARDHIRKEGYCVIVEGQTDVILSHQAGVENVVAVSGTALTEWHLKRLKFLTDTLVLSFDMDEAGFEAARRVVGLAHDLGFTVKVIGMAQDKDPADIVQSSPEAWEELVQGALPVVQFFLQGVLKSVSASSVEGKRAVRERVLPLVQSLGSAIERAHWISRIASAIAVPESAVWQDLQAVKREESAAIPASEQVQKDKPRTRLELLEEYFLSLLLWKPEVCAVVGANDISFSSPQSVSLWNALRQKQFPEHSLEEIMKELPQESNVLVNHLLLKIEVLAVSLKDVGQEVQQTLAEINQARRKQMLDVLSQSIKEAEAKGDNLRRDELLRQFNEFSKKLV